MSNFKNLCPRCGRERIITKTWTEKTVLYGTETIITHEEAVCPDKDCQKLLEEKLFEEKTKRDGLKKNAEDRIAAKKKASRTAIAAR